MLLACVGIETEDAAAVVGCEEQAVRDGDGRKAAVNRVEKPDLAGFGDVTGLGGINADQLAASAPVFRVLADGGVNAVVVEDWRGDALAGAGFVAVFAFAVGGGVKVELPDGLQAAEMFAGRGRGWFCVEGVAAAVAGAEENQLATVDDAR